MDDDGGLGIRNWGYYDQSSLKSNLGLQLMSSVTKRDTKPFLSGSGRDPVCMIPANNTFLHRDCGVSENQISMDFVRESWMTQRDKFLHGFSNNQTYAALSEPSAPHHSLHILPQPDSLKDEKLMQTDEAAGKRDGPLKKRSNGQAYKTPKVKKTKKVMSKDETKSSVPKTRPRKQNTEMVINGMDLDISGLPIPVCSCTGAPQQCYKWGIGGWQSACCTTSISMYPLPMSTKRRGARIAGRKMSQGAFKKVLEKLASEGHNLSHPIDLKTHWAKHGTNKFVTIR